jgi:protein-tyrosine phosphatase
MDWVTDDIAIGNYLEAQDRGLLQREGIVAVLCLDRTLQGKAPTDLGLKAIEVIPLEDGAGNDPRLFRRAVDTLTDLCQQGGPVLVQCHAGRSRSAVVVAGYLVKTLGIAPEEALARLAAKREVAVAPGLLHLLDCLS